MTANHIVPANLRPPAEVMRLSVLGSFCQTRLSFMRTLLRRLKREQWQFTRKQWDIDANGVGVAVYEARSPQRVYSLVVYAHDTPPLRSDRVIAEAWDATFTLVDGTPDAAEIEQMAANVPRQEAGRHSARQLVLSRANRSTRMFDYVVNCLAAQQQPQAEKLDETGYLMRTTAVYGNGKFGLADRSRLTPRAEFAAPFQAELLTVWLFRNFAADWAEHLAAVENPQAIKLAPHLRRRLGIGNSTGLGMAPFLSTHPALLHCWIAARETALAQVRALTAADTDTQQLFLHFLARAAQTVAEWETVDNRQQQKIAQLAADLQKIQQAAPSLLTDAAPWDALYRWADAALATEGREMLVSLMLEVNGETVDALADGMGCDEEAAFIIDGEQPAAAMLAVLRQHYDWIWREDFSAANATARFWYTSEEKLEPRLGERYEEPGAQLELPSLAVMRDMQQFWRDLEAAEAGCTLGDFLAHYPQHRHLARRAQQTANFPYGEIQDNLISAAMLPLDMLRCKLSFFGATKFDPRSDRWLRITMYQDAPYPCELADSAADDWAWRPLAE